MTDRRADHVRNRERERPDKRPDNDRTSRIGANVRSLGGYVIPPPDNATARDLLEPPVSARLSIAPKAPRSITTLWENGPDLPFPAVSTGTALFR